MDHKSLHVTGRGSIMVKFKLLIIFVIIVDS